MTQNPASSSAARATIRHAVDRDRVPLLTLIAQFQEFERTLRPNLPRGPLIAEPQLAFLESCAADGDGFLMVAELDDHIVGFAAGVIEHERGQELPEVERIYGCVTDLFVVESLRRHGVARALLDAAEQHFRERRLCTMRISHLSGNAGAARCYRAFGFEPSHETLLKPIG